MDTSQLSKRRRHIKNPLFRPFAYCRQAQSVRAIITHEPRPQSGSDKVSVETRVWLSKQNTPQLWTDRRTMSTLPTPGCTDKTENTGMDFSQNGVQWIGAPLTYTHTHMHGAYATTTTDLWLQCLQLCEAGSFVVQHQQIFMRPGVLV